MKDWIIDVLDTLESLSRRYAGAEMLIMGMLTITTMVLAIIVIVLELSALVK